MFPPVALFEEVAEPEDFDAIAALRARTDPGISAQIAFAAQIPRKDLALGPGAGYVMAPFVFVSPEGTRFGPPAMTSSAFGVFYAARDEATAIAEVKHHRTRFLREIRAPAQDLDFEVLNSEIKGSGFYDIREQQKKFGDVYSPRDYSSSQELAIDLKARDADGIVYDSVRREGGECVAVFRPRCVSRCRPVKHLSLRWDGDSITAVLEAQASE